MTMVPKRMVVWWDMWSSPVPPDYDIRCIRPCIELASEKFYGPGHAVTIYAFSEIEKVEEEIREKIIPSGLLFRHTPDVGDFISHMREWTEKNPPGESIIMIICDVKSQFEDIFRKRGFFVIRPSYWTVKALLKELSPDVEIEETETSTHNEDPLVCLVCKFSTPSIHAFKEHCSEHKRNLSRAPSVFLPEDTLPNKAAVWWDINRCLLPRDCDPRDVRRRIESALKKSFGDSCSVTIYAIGLVRRTSQLGDLLHCCGIEPKYTESGILGIYDDMLSWSKENQPPAAMMLISEAGVPFHDLLPSYEENGFTIIRAYPLPDNSSREWLWENFIKEETSMHALDMDALNDELKELEHMRDSSKTEINSAKKASFVWWDINSCHVPHGIDPLCVRLIIESTLKNPGPVTIYAVGDINSIPFLTIKAISSPGIFVKHNENKLGLYNMFDDLSLWSMDNPPPANIVILSKTEPSKSFTDELFHYEACGYTVILRCPGAGKTSKDWLWEDLMEDTHEEINKQMDKFNETEEPPWFCMECRYPSYSYHNFTKHLRGAAHAYEVRDLSPCDFVKEIVVKTSRRSVASRLKKALKNGHSP